MTAFFTNALKWKKQIVTGGSSNTQNISGTTNDIIPYGGRISSQESKRSFATANRRIYSDDDIEDDTTQFLFYDFIKPFHCFYVDTEKSLTDEGWSVSILKKDGSWDVVYDAPYWISKDIKMSDFTFHYNDEEYARTCDGYLRCRITDSDIRYMSNRPPYNEYDVKYLVIDYLPQKAELQFDKVIGPTEISMTRAIQQDYDEYLRDIKIGIKNLEGVESVLVEQLIEGDRIPTKFEVEDFKNGYFTATVDKEFYSWFTVVTTNKNGSVRSETLEIAPLEPATDASYGFDVKVTDDVVSISGDSKRLYERNRLQSYRIESLSRVGGTTGLAGEIYENHVEIDVSGLENGIYVLLYSDSYGREYSHKFVKR
ncbi:MAG: hypothetical protein NC117_07350 [Pseudoflavonifractor sp.]|nr:hypothetical protein [Pseudoflavonifractor sp.]